MRRLLRFCAALVALSFIGCGAADPSRDSGSPVDDAGNVTIPFELGTGATQWEDIAPSGQHVKLIMGPQGGYHVLGRVRFSGFNPDVNLRFRVSCTSTGQVYNNPDDVLRRRDRQGLVNTGTAWESSTAELVILTQIRSPAEVAGHTVRWDVTLEEAGTGRTARASREFVIDYP
ncbi:MAG: hypothetical protein U0269_04460 [Polyangiales bacterium]